MREDQIANGVQFLTHPKVKQAPLEERISFLRNKGMTEEEIQEAVRRANEVDGKSDGGANGSGSDGEGMGADGANLAPHQQLSPQGGPGPGMSSPVPGVPGRGYPPREQTWAEKYLVPGTLALSAGAGMAFLYKTMVLKQSPQQWLGPWVPPGMPGSSPPLSPSQGPFPPPMQQGMPGQPPVMPQQQQQQQQQPMPSNTNSLPGAPGAMTALVAQGKPVPSAAQYEMEKENTLVPFDQSSMFGKAPYATPDAMLALAGGAGGDGYGYGSTINSAAQEELLSATKQQTDVLKQMSSALTDLTSKIDDLQKSGQNGSSNEGASNNDKWVAGMTQAHSDLRSELNTIKTLLLTRGAENGSGSGLSTEEIAKVLSASASSTPDVPESKGTKPQEKAGSSIDDLIKAANNSTATEIEKEAEGPSNEEIKEKHMHASRTALAKMMQACPEDKKRAAVNMLLMYFRNLHKEPQVPRYGRIARTNSSFAKALGEVDHHLEFLQANGFAERTSGTMHGSRAQMLEWGDDWRENAENWALDVLKDSITNLEAVLKDADDKRKAQASSKAVENSALKSAAVPNSMTPNAGTANLVATGPAKPAFKAPPFALNAYSNGADAVASSESTSKNDSNQANSPPDIPGFPAAPTPMPSKTATSAASSEDTAKKDDDYPLSYSEVMAMVQKGERPPGIKDIPNELSADASNPTESSMKPVPKPWEKADNGLMTAKDTGDEPNGPEVNGADEATYYHPTLFGNNNTAREESVNGSNSNNGEEGDNNASATFADVLRRQQEASQGGAQIEEIQ